MIGESSKTIITEFNNIIRSFRFTQKCFVVCNVDYVYIKGLHFALETFGFDDRYFKENKIRNMQTSCLVRYINDDHPNKIIYLGVARITVNDVLEQYKQSLEFKQKNWIKLEKHGGAVSTFMDKDQRKNFAKILLETAENGGWNGKKTTLNNYFQDAKIHCDTYQKKLIIKETMKIKKEPILETQN